MMDRIKLAQDLRARIDAATNAAKKLIVIDDLTEDELTEIRSLYDAYKVGKKYDVGEIVRDGDDLYKIVQAHTAQKDWRPADTAALYKKVGPENVIIEWVQPKGAHDAYKKGDRVTYSGAVWESTMDGNVWAPPTYWQEVKA